MRNRTFQVVDTAGRKSDWFGSAIRAMEHYLLLLPARPPTLLAAEEALYTHGAVLRGSPTPRRHPHPTWKPVGWVVEFRTLVALYRQAAKPPASTGVAGPLPA